jgi:uncharacterized protein (DUF362 family)
MNRREFFKKSLAIGSVAGLTFIIDGIKPRGLLNAQNNSAVIPDLVAIKGGNPDVMFDKGIAEFGGMKKFVKKGQTVVIKPNIGWNRTPDYGANTNPFLIKRIIEHCINAGAKKVYVFDNTCDYWKDCYTNSGIEKSALDAGAQVVPGNKESYYQSININNAQILRKTKIHQLILESDVLINVPVLKSHGSTGLTIAMKNLMGAVWDRGFFHQSGLHTCITDFCFAKKPTLNIVDAYTFMKSGGPRGINKENTMLLKSQLISTDIVAIDAAAAKLAGVNPENVQYIKMGNDRKLGVMDLSKLNIKRLTV